jgi:hypothetical protein
VEHREDTVDNMCCLQLKATLGRQATAAIFSNARRLGATAVALVINKCNLCRSKVNFRANSLVVNKSEAFGIEFHTHVSEKLRACRSRQPV